MKIRHLTYGLILIMTVMSTVTLANDELIKKPFATSYHSFTIINNLIVVRAELGGVRGNYIFDTGASGLILNKDHQSEMLASSTEIISASTSSNTLEKHISKFQFGNITKRDFAASCLSLAHIESSMNMHIDGLIGMEVLHGAAVIIDYNSQMLLLADPTRDHSGYDVELDIEVISGIPTVKSYLHGLAINLAIDFGATSTILDKKIADQLNLEVIEQVNLLTTVGQSDALNKVKCEDLLLGEDFQFDTKAIVTDLSHLQSPDESIHGIVGLDLLQSGKVLLNSSEGKLRIWTSK